MYQNRTESVSKPNTFILMLKVKFMIFRSLNFWHYLDYVIREIKN